MGDKDLIGESPPVERSEGESIWGRKDLIGGKHFGWKNLIGRKPSLGAGGERFNWRKAFGGLKI